MFQSNATLKLNLIMLGVAALFFACVLLMPGPRVATTVGSASPPPSTPTTQLAAAGIRTTQPADTPTATRTPAPTGTPTPTPTVEPPTPTPTATSTPAPSRTPTPTATTEPPTATPTPETATRHTVAPGETLSVIAAQYGVTVEAIVAANGLEDPNRLEVGQELVIPTAPPRES